MVGVEDLQTDPERNDDLNFITSRWRQPSVGWSVRRHDYVVHLQAPTVITEQDNQVLVGYNGGGTPEAFDLTTTDEIAELLIRERMYALATVLTWAEWRGQRQRNRDIRAEAAFNAWRDHVGLAGSGTFELLNANAQEAWRQVVAAVLDTKEGES